ncbi:hypothetical protein CN918_31220 [Priestia megaterium]|nr:hypothetical protein CN918_31220 [Priestia megaterium]
MTEKITLYHGSPKKFNAFKIDPSLAITKITDLQEGVGVYMSDNPLKAVTAKYPYIYTIEVEKEETADFTQKDELMNYLLLVNADVAKLIQANIVDYLNMKQLIQGVLNGELVITQLHDSIKEMLDNQEGFYLEFQDFIDDEDSPSYLYLLIEKSCKKHLKDVFRYYDRGFDFPIWICVDNPEKLSIVSVQEK